MQKTIAMGTVAVENVNHPGQVRHLDGDLYGAREEKTRPLRLHRA